MGDFARTSNNEITLLGNDVEIGINTDPRTNISLPDTHDNLEYE